MIWVKVINGPYHANLKDIDLVGEVLEDEAFSMMGCKRAELKKLCKAIVDMGRKEPRFYFRTANDAWWHIMGGGKIPLFIQSGDWEEVHPNLSKTCFHCNKDYQELDIQVNYCPKCGRAIEKYLPERNGVEAKGETE